MDSDSLQARKREIVERFGEWTAHNIRLPDGSYTKSDAVSGDEVKLRRAVQVVQDVAAKPFDELRMVDLGCLEGLYAIEFAQRGAEVVGIEGREANLAKARLACEALGLSNVEFVQDDVRNLSVERYGRFDVVFCWGLLYHLDAPEVFTFVQDMARVCDGFALIDTHVALAPHEIELYGRGAFWIDVEHALSDLHAVQHDGREYWGRSYVEHLPGSTPEERLRALWSSLDNPRSFWPTRQSLLNLLADAGFTSAFECELPPEVGKPPDRVTLIALRGGARAGLRATDLLEGKGWERLPEPAAPSPEAPPASAHRRARVLARRAVAARVRRLARRRSMRSPS